MCLYTAVYNICPDGGIIFDSRDGPYCVRGFNQKQTTKLSGASFFQLVCVSNPTSDDGKYVRLQKTSTGHHFFSIQCTGDSKLIIYDDAVKRPAVISQPDFADFSNAESRLFFFRLSMVAKRPDISDPLYYAVGGGLRRGAASGASSDPGLRTPLTRCVVCKSKLAQYEVTNVKIVTHTGLVTRRHNKLRCGGKSCRGIFGANYYVESGGRLLNTIPDAASLGDVVLSIGEVGFDSSYLRVHLSASR